MVPAEARRTFTSDAKRTAGHSDTRPAARRPSGGMPGGGGAGIPASTAVRRSTPRRLCYSAASSTSSLTAGSANPNSAPPLSRSVAQIRPFMASTSAFDTNRPIPAPAARLATCGDR